MAQTRTTDLTPVQEAERWYCPIFTEQGAKLPHKQRTPSGLSDSGLVVVEDTNDAFEFLIRPPVAALGNLLAIVPFLIFALWWDYDWFVSSRFDTDFAEGSRVWWSISLVSLVAFLFCFGFPTWSAVRMLTHWTRVRISHDAATLHHPNWRGKEVRTDFPLTAAEITPKGRYEQAVFLKLTSSEQHHIIPSKWMTPVLTRDQGLWLLDKITPFIEDQPTPEPTKPELVTA